MGKWAAEPDPWLHSYAKYDWSDTWNRINISASAVEINVTIVDHPASARTTDVPSRDISRGEHVDGTIQAPVDFDGAPDVGVWVIKIHRET